MRLARPYPVRGGVPIAIQELELPPSRLNLSVQHNFNNHHSCFTARQFGRLAISQTFRDLAIFQQVIPKDTHNLIHARYDPQKHLPDLITMLDIIDEQAASGGLLRYGSAHSPTYIGITKDLLADLMLEYEKVV